MPDARSPDRVRESRTQEIHVYTPYERESLHLYHADSLSSHMNDSRTFTSLSERMVNDPAAQVHLRHPLPPLTSLPYGCE